MADPDIPMAYAMAPGSVTPVSPPLSAAPPRPTLRSTGRSSRVMLPNQKSKVLGQSDIQALKQQGFTEGLARAMSKNNAAFPIRIWVVDNSGSMTQSDGHRLVETKKKDDVRAVSCTRWREIQETVTYHAQMAALLEAPTVFRMLNDPGAINGPQQFGVAEKGADGVDEDLSVALSTIRNTSPTGGTPLAQHIREVRDNLKEMQNDLVRNGHRVVLVLATDGLPTDEYSQETSKDDFVQTLRSLEGLPMWVVIRLCTDEEQVVNFYNSLDSQLELSLEVLDDFMDEAKEVNEHNEWLNYGLPLHRCREMGYHDRLFDLLDERPLTKDELQDFLFLLLGEGKFDGIPDAQADWKGFTKAVAEMIKSEKKQWNPRTKKVEPWIDVKLLKKKYGGTGCIIL